MVEFNFWEAAGGVAGGASALAMLAFSLYDRFRRSIRAEAADSGALENHNTRLAAVERSLDALTQSQTDLNTAMVRHIGVDEILFKNIDATLKRFERGMEQLRAQVRLNGKIRADETYKIERLGK